jgi:uncharacterized protein YkwD
VALACALLVCPSAGASAAAEEGGDAEVTRVNGTSAAAPVPARAAYGEQTTSGAGDPDATGERSGAGQASGTRQGSVIDETSVTDVPGGCRNVSMSARAVSLSVLRASFLCLINTERAINAAPAVAPDGFLQRSADAHSHDMAFNRFFGHISPAGSTLLTHVRRAGYLEDARRWLLGETLVRGEGDITSYALFTALMGSPAHSEIIHDGRYRQVGVGLERGTSTGDGGLTVTLNFGVVTARK